LKLQKNFDIKTNRIIKLSSILSGRGQNLTITSLQPNYYFRRCLFQIIQHTQFYFVQN